MNRFVSCVPPLRWQPVFGAGSAILSCGFSCFGGSCMVLGFDWPSLFPPIWCSILVCHLSLYIEIRWWVYERTTLWINKTWLFQKMKRAFTLERQAIFFFLQKGFLITSFGISIFCYQLMYPEIEKGNLVNPLQVIAQLSCFLFNFTLSTPLN